MEMLFDRDSLYDAVHTVSAAVSARSPRPVLQCIHLETRGAGVVLSATDLTIAIRQFVTPRELVSEGQGLVVGTRLDGILREASEKEVSLRIEGGEAELRAGRSRFKLVTQDVAEYPRLPEFQEAAVSVAGGKLDELIRRTLFAAAGEGGRYALDGVSLFVEGGKMELAATDGRRLAVASAGVDGEGAIERCVVPKEMMGKLRGIAASAEAVELVVEEGKLLARAGDVVAAGSLIEGVFPAYMEMLPKERGEPVCVASQVFASKLRQATQLTTEDNRTVTFRIESGRMVIEAKGAGIGEGSIEIDATYGGEPVAINFNPQFLLQVLGEFGDEDFSMEISSGDKPAVLRREGFIYVVAPVRTRG